MNYFWKIFHSSPNGLSGFLINHNNTIYVPGKWYTANGKGFHGFKAKRAADICAEGSRGFEIRKCAYRDGVVKDSEYYFKGDVSIYEVRVVVAGEMMIL